MKKIEKFNTESITNIQMENLNPKNPVSEKKKKKSLYGLMSKLETTKDLMNLRIDQQKLFNMNKEKQVFKSQQSKDLQ